jgi:hypothetical protein
MTPTALTAAMCGTFDMCDTYETYYNMIWESEFFMEDKIAL